MAESTLASGIYSKPAKTLLVACFLILTLVSTNSIEARQIGIVSEGGCGCHGGMNSNTVITVDGLPDTMNQRNIFTLTISNENVPVQNPDQNGGFRLF